MLLGAYTKPLVPGISRVRAYGSGTMKFFWGGIKLALCIPSLCGVHRSLSSVLGISLTLGIMDELGPSERKLFADNIRRLDKRIHQGMTKLTWSSKGEC